MITLASPDRKSDERAAVSAADFAMIAEIVHARSGILLGLDKVYLVESRLAPVARKWRLTGMAELSARLRQRVDNGLANDVVEAMTTNETLFFRDAKPFDHLREVALPALHAAHPPGRPLRIWSAASSSGQEAYSIAMTVLDAGLGRRPFEIIGTDISPEQIKRATAGVYSDFEVQRGLPVGILNRHFCKGPGGWQISAALRSSVAFRVFNLLDDSQALGVFDLVFCRNVLIYFDVATRRQVLSAIWQRLSPGGLLYLGGSETTLGVSDRFIRCAGAYQVYAAIPA